MRARLEIKLLGKPEVWLDGEQLTSFSTAKTEALLYYLAVTKQTHSRETLSGLLWGEMPEAKARRNLTKSLSVLRRMLDPYLLIEAKRVAFCADTAYELDVTRLEAAATSPKPSPDIFTLYRGDFLEGFFVKDSLAFEEWQLAQREWLRETAIGLLEAGIEKASATGDFATGIAHGRRLLEMDPWRESAHRQLMLLLARHGQHTAALSQYQLCREVLATELGVEPGAETTALFLRIRAARSKPSFALPHEAAPLVGRERELARIQQLLQNPECRLLTITGLGGMGKTRLAIAAAHQANQESTLLFLNGVAFVSLAGVASVPAVPLALANAMDIPLSSAVTPRRALLNFLHNQELLIVLDNMEHLTESAELLLELLQSSPHIKILVTSRIPLDLSSEWRLNLEGLSIPSARVSDLATLRSYAAMILFARSASQVDSRFRLSEDNAAQIGQLIRRVAGIPLALQLAATWLRTMSISSVLDEVERDLDFLATDMQDIPPRQRSMRAIFESTWQMLSAEERQAIETLSICRGGFTQEAASTTANTTPILLRRIINRALIFQQDETRYDMHPLTRQHARERLEASGRAETAASIHGRYYLLWLRSQVAPLHGSTPQNTINAIGKDLDNLRQAWEWALRARETELLLDGLMALATYYDLLGLLQEGEALADSAISHLGDVTNTQEERLMCRALVTKCQFVVAMGQYQHAAGTVESIFDLARRLHDEESIADIHHINGRILTDTGKYNDAKQRYKQALSGHRQLANIWKMARTLAELGWTHILDGEADAALPILQEALALERKAGHKRGEAFVLGNLSVAYSIRGEPQKALPNQLRVLAAYEDLGDLLNLERAENNIGMVYLSLGQYKEAIPHIQHAVELSRQVDALPGLANALDTLGTALLACGQYEEAKACLEEALSSALAIGYVYITFSVRAVLVRLFNCIGDLDQAEQHLQQLRSSAERLENAGYLARSLAEQGHLAYVQGGLAEAADLTAQAIDILRQNPAPLEMPFFLLQHAECLHEQQRFAEARPLLEEAIEAAQRFQHEPLLIRGCALAANLSNSLGDVEAAQSYEKTARHHLTQLVPYPDVLAGLLYLGRYRSSSGDNRAALRISTFVAKHPASANVVRCQAIALQRELTDFSPGLTANSEPLGWQELVSSARW